MLGKDNCSTGACSTGACSSTACSTECKNCTPRCTACTEPTFAAKQLPRQIQGQYRTEQKLAQIDRVISEQPDGQSTIVVEFKDTFDEWQWKQTGANWSSWVRSQTNAAFDDEPV